MNSNAIANIIRGQSWDKDRNATLLNLISYATLDFDGMANIIQCYGWDDGKQTALGIMYNKVVNHPTIAEMVSIMNCFKWDDGRFKCLVTMVNHNYSQKIAYSNKNIAQLFSPMSWDDGKLKVLDFLINHVELIRTKEEFNEIFGPFSDKVKPMRKVSAMISMDHKVLCEEISKNVKGVDTFTNLCEEFKIPQNYIIEFKKNAVATVTVNGQTIALPSGKDGNTVIVPTGNGSAMTVSPNSDGSVDYEGNGISIKGMKTNGAITISNDGGVVCLGGGSIVVGNGGSVTLGGGGYNNWDWD